MSHRWDLTIPGVSPETQRHPVRLDTETFAIPAFVGRALYGAEWLNLCLWGMAAIPFFLFRVMKCNSPRKNW